MGRSELRRRGRRLRLSASLTQLLKLLVAQSPQLVTREQIAACLWDQPQYVDVASGINTAVNRLRVVLEDHSAEPVYIETVVGLGYRFVARVQHIREPLQGSPSSETKPEATDGCPQAFLSFEGPHETAEDNPASAAFLTQPDVPSAVGHIELERVPYAPVHSTGEAAERKVISQVLPPRAFRLSQGWIVALSCLLSAIAAILVWRHDSRNPASAAGDRDPLSQARFFQATFNDGANRTSTAAVSHRGQMVAYFDARGISIRALDRKIDRLISTPSNLLVSRFSWSPSDSVLLVSGKQKDTGKDQVWKVPLSSESPALLFENANEAVWSPDGAQIAFVRPQGAELWLSDANGGSQRRLSEASEQDRISSLLWSPDGKRLVYDKRVPPAEAGYLVNPALDPRTYGWQYECVNAVTGKLLAMEVNFQFDSAYILSDGRMYFPKGDPLDANYAAQLYMVKTDPESGRFRSEPRPIRPLFGYNAFGVSASDSGDTVAVILDRVAETVFVADLQFSGPNQEPSLGTIQSLHQSALDNYPHAWTPSGDAVIFESNQSADYSIYRQRLDGSPPELLALSYGQAVMPQITPDGNWILFENFSNSRWNEISRVSIHGGEPQQVPTQGKTGEFQCSVSSHGICVLREATGKYLIYFALDPIHGIGKELGRIPWVEHNVGDWTISPDGSTIALPVLDPNHPAIRLVTLGSGAQSQTRDIEVQGQGTVVETTWAADSKGFYVERKTPTDFALLYVDLAGKSTVLRTTKSKIWGVPSRDQKRLAFVDYSLNRNLWVARQPASPTR